MDFEATTMQLIVNSGTARSKAMEAIGAAKAGDIDGARRLIEEADEALTKAHESQTELIQEELQGNVDKVSLLMAHSQDHLMNAITVKDLALEFIDIYVKLSTLK